MGSETVVASAYLLRNSATPWETDPPMVRLWTGVKG